VRERIKLGAADSRRSQKQITDDEQQQQISEGGRTGDSKRMRSRR
jgi:hypothetical protein